MKILMITNQVKTYALGFQNVIDPMRSLGHEVVWAANFSRFVGDKSEIPCKTVHITDVSNPLNKSNLAAFRTLQRVVDEEQIDVIYCSTPIGGALGRLVGWKKHVPMVIYAAHGFLFFKGAPLINRTVYKLEEQILSHVTDVLITINQEDYEASKKLRLRRNGRYFMVHGAGVEVGRQVDVDRDAKRKELGIPENSFAVVSAGFLNQNKNNRVIIEALSQCPDLKLHYLICGEGEKADELKALSAKLGVEDRVSFLGFRTDMAQIMASSDCFAMPSFREGVPRALLEAMDLGVPCVGSRRRGISELIGDNEGGYLCDPSRPEEFADAFRRMIEHPENLPAMAMRNQAEAQKYSKEVVRQEMKDIFRTVLQ